MTIGLDRSRRGKKYVSRQGVLVLTGYYHQVGNKYHWQAQDSARTVVWVTNMSKPNQIDYQASMRV